MKIDVIAFVLWKTIWFYPHTAKTNGPKDRYGTNDSTLVSNLAGLIQRRRDAWREHTFFSTISRIATAKRRFA